MFSILFIIILSILLAFGTLLLLIITKLPFSYPYFYHDFDVSRKRNPQLDTYLNDFLSFGGFSEIEQHKQKIEEWKEASNRQICKSSLKKLRQKQYLKAIDDENAFVFSLARSQTRYKQENYVKTPYKVMVRVESRSYSYEYLKQRCKMLKK